MRTDWHRSTHQLNDRPTSEVIGKLLMQKHHFLISLLWTEGINSNWWKTYSCLWYFNLSLTPTFVLFFSFLMIVRRALPIFLPFRQGKGLFASTWQRQNKCFHARKKGRTDQSHHKWRQKKSKVQAFKHHGLEWAIIYLSI